MHQYVPAEGDVVLDIGAATGWETLAFSKCVGQRGHVISVEAHPRTFFCLQEMCRRNKLKNVTLFNCAATATEAVVYLSDRPLYVANSIVQNGSGSSVRGRTIASIFSEFNFSRVDLLKMDIEGAERGAIEGLDNVIEKTRYVCIECHDFLATHRGAEDMRTRSTVIEFLKAKGFEIVLRDSDPRPHIRDTVYGSNTRLNSDEEVRRGALASY
jgi:FkbM family methyltransferase